RRGPSQNGQSKGESARSPRSPQQNNSNNSRNQKQQSRGDQQRPRRSKEEQDLFLKRKEDNACFECGLKDHKARDCEIRLARTKVLKEVAAEPDLEGGGAFPRELLAKVALQGQNGFDALVDTGASHSIMKHSVPQLIGAAVRSYKKPQRLNLGAKGSHATAYKYVETELTVGSVTRRWRFILLNIKEDVILGRDFLRSHSVLISFNPDRIDVSQTPRYPHAREPKRRFASNKPSERSVNMLERTDAASPFDKESNPPPHSDAYEPTPIPLRPYELLSFKSSIEHEDLGHVEGWQAPKEVMEEFFNDVVQHYKAKGIIKSKEEILPQPPHRGALDHDVPYFDESKD
ncbi:hypothetical protein JCM11641_000616, partial [Rhodosporidiobolus odoratus]